MVELSLVIDEQQAEKHLIHPLAHGIERHLVLRGFYLTLPTGNFLLVADGAAIEEGLLDVDTHPVLVFFQSLEMYAHLIEHVLHLRRPSRNIALECSLCRCRDLWQPSFLDVVYCQLGGLSDEVVLSDEGIVALGGSHAFV